MLKTINFRTIHFLRHIQYVKITGYIVGEHFNCPTCGERAEVYSRITGYYRPVQNWNDGKAQEFKERRLYNIETSRLVRDGVESGVELEEKPEVAVAVATLEAGNNYLFTTKTCPNCRAVKTVMDKAGLEYEVIDAEENAELSNSIGIKTVPTLIAADGTVHLGAGAIRAHIG